MRRIVAYDIVYANSRDEMVASMARLIDIGWEPFGELYFIGSGQFRQVVVKYDNTPLEQLLRLAKALIGLKFGIGGG